MAKSKNADESVILQVDIVLGVPNRGSRTHIRIVPRRDRAYVWEEHDGEVLKNWELSVPSLIRTLEEYKRDASIRT